MPLTDWKALARARGSQLENPELDRILEPLATLEARFRPLAEALPATLDPAPIFRADAESRE
ncbi:MAG TPA: hypothetical protein VKV17_18150 [Bryobacteraceae bacterium]|nr:hypothetical protein [Bryobacteraceae bacterium]